MEGTNYKKGLWTDEEDKILMDYVRVHGQGRWNHIAKMAGLKRCGKSCRLRWMNSLSPNVKRGNFSEEEEDLIIRLHNLLGNRWSLIAGRVPGRTDNQVKNHWNARLSKRLGIRKDKRKSCTSSLTVSGENARGKENLGLPRDSTSKASIDGTDDREIEVRRKEGYQNNAGVVYDQLEPMNNLWVSHENLNLSFPYLADLFVDTLLMCLGIAFN